jgi:anaerobic selenocysteine-containing dehydrogenase
MFAGPLDVAKTASATGITPAELLHLAQIFAAAQHPLAIPGGGLSGLLDANAALTAVQALNFIAGNTGMPGGMSLSADSPLPKQFVKPQPSTFSNMLSLLGKMKAGIVKVLLVIGPNPAYELPLQAGFADALAKVPFVVSFAPIVDETAAQADLILPERTYLESWGYDVVDPAFDGPMISSQQPVVTPLFDARSAADVLLAAAKGIPAAAKALPWSDEVAYLKEMVAQLPPDPRLGPGGVVWERYLQHGGWFMAPQAAAAATAPAAPAITAQPLQLTAPKFQGDAGTYPFFLHLYVSSLLSDGRGANLPWLQASPDPLTTGAWQTLVEINPATAQKIGVVDGEVVKVTSPYGEIEGYVYTYPAMRPDTVAIATGQGHTDYGRYGSQHGSNPIQLMGAQLAWSTVRVNVTGTGKKVKLSIFEWKMGVQEGFPNQAFPGE